MIFSLHSLLTPLCTLLAAALGAALADWVGLPLPMLTGPLIAVSGVALAGVAVGLPVGLRNLCFVILGTNMGSSVTPATLQTVAAWPGSLAILSVCIVLIMGGGAVLLRRAAGLDPASGLLGSTPGHLSMVIALSESSGGNTGLVVAIQTIRVAALTLLVPLLARLALGAPLPALPDQAVAPWPALGALMAGGVLVALGLKRLRLPAPFILGPLLVSAGCHGGGWVVGAGPGWLVAVTLVVIGALIGTRFAGMSLRQLGGALWASTLLSLWIVAVTLAGAWMSAILFGLPFLSTLIAFAPGGLETMMALSLMLEADPAYVAAHHVWRLLLLAGLVGVAMRWIAPERTPPR